VATHRLFIIRRNSLDEGSACRWDPYLTTYDIIKRQTSLPVVVLEPAVPASERQQTYASDRRIIRLIGTIFFYRLRTFRRKLKIKAVEYNITTDRCIELVFDYTVRKVGRWSHLSDPGWNLICMKNNPDYSQCTKTFLWNGKKGLLVILNFSTFSWTEGDKLRKLSATTKQNSVLLQ